jgi:hypothetical protein
MDYGDNHNHIYAYVGQEKGQDCQDHCVDLDIYDWSFYVFMLICNMLHVG